jgi:hypothetical protein
MRRLHFCMPARFLEGSRRPFRRRRECENCLACVHNCPQKAISIIPTPPEPEEPNRNARYRNPNVSIADLIKANSQI